MMGRSLVGSSGSSKSSKIKKTKAAEEIEALKAQLTAQRQLTAQLNEVLDSKYGSSAKKLQELLHHESRKSGAAPTKLQAFYTALQLQQQNQLLQATVKLLLENNAELREAMADLEARSGMQAKPVPAVELIEDGDEDGEGKEQGLFWEGGVQFKMGEGEERLMQVSIHKDPIVVSASDSKTGDTYATASYSAAWVDAAYKRRMASLAGNSKAKAGRSSKAGSSSSSSSAPSAAGRGGAGDRFKEEVPLLQQILTLLYLVEDPEEEVPKDRMLLFVVSAGGGDDDQGDGKGLDTTGSAVYDDDFEDEGDDDEHEDERGVPPLRYQRYPARGSDAKTQEAEAAGADRTSVLVWREGLKLKSGQYATVVVHLKGMPDTDRAGRIGRVLASSKKQLHLVPFHSIVKDCPHAAFVFQVADSDKGRHTAVYSLARAAKLATKLPKQAVADVIQHLVRSMVLNKGAITLQL